LAVQEFVHVGKTFGSPAGCELVCQGLADAVDLIVMPTPWECKKLCFEIMTATRFRSKVPLPALQ
jgi:hypothetical protein